MQSRWPYTHVRISLLQHSKLSSRWRRAPCCGPSKKDSLKIHIVYKGKPSNAVWTILKTKENDSEETINEKKNICVENIERSEPEGQVTDENNTALA